MEDTPNFGQTLTAAAQITKIMKKIIIFWVMLLFSITLSAQINPEKTHWFDGNSYYTAQLYNGGIFLFNGVSADGENKFSFYIKPEVGGDQLQEDSGNSGYIPFRVPYGARAQFTTVGNTGVIAFLDKDFNIAWTLVQTTKGKNDCLASQLWHKEQPLEWTMSNMIMNTDYLSIVSKTQLRYMEETLSAKSKRSELEEINLSLIKSEQKVPDYIRYNITDTEFLTALRDYDYKEVNTAADFLNAIESGAKIKIADNTTINLSEILLEHNYFTEEGRMWIGESETELTHYTEQVIISEFVFDGRQLSLANFSNLTIKGGYNSHLVVDPAYAYVINFINCSDITIENLTMGHTVEGYCMGGVIGMENCTDVNINSCDLYGCGAYGIVARKSSLAMNKSIIRDCSYGIMQLYGVTSAQFSKCDFFRNKEFGMVEVDDNSSNVTFDDCRFAQNYGVLFLPNSPIEINNSLIRHPYSDGLGYSPHIKISPSTEIFFDKAPLVSRQIGPRKGKSVY